MERRTNITYEGKCPICGRPQSDKKPENVDIECFECSLAKGKIIYVNDISDKALNFKNYKDDNDKMLEMAIELQDRIVLIRTYVPRYISFGNREEFNRYLELIK